MEDRPQKESNTQMISTIINDNDEDDENNLEKFNERFCRLRKSNKFTDCSFKIENQVINCHKLILTAASPVFEAMFYGKFDITNSILITDVSLKNFELFIDYLYTGTLKLKEFEEIDSLLEIASCAQKYIVIELRKKCVSRLREMLTRDNVFKFFSKAFDFHLEDFLVACLYFFVDILETKMSLCNVIISRNTDELPSPSSFEFLVKNLLDYFGDCQEVLLMIKGWSLNTALQTNLNDLIVNNLNLDSLLSEKIVQMKTLFMDSPPQSKIPRSFHRIYYKPVRPFIIEKAQNYFDVEVSFRKFVIVKKLMLNSRLFPEQYDFCDMNNQTYNEDIEVEVFEKSTNQIIFNNHQNIENVAYNASFQVKIDERMVFFPYTNYIVRFKWNENDTIGFEYPRAIFSFVEKSCNSNQPSVVQFNEYNFNLPAGSIVQGIFYDIIN